jgi:uncharacterized membrane protein (Fun14 family)
MKDQVALESAKSWWQKINLQKWFGEASGDAVQVAICFVSFFAVGFLFKKYLKFVFLCLIVCFLLIKGLEYYNILDIDWSAFNKFVGIGPEETFSSLAGNVFEWVKKNVVVTVASALGFLLGYKLG